jgi:YihY family inner membrane protein
MTDNRDVRRDRLHAVIATVDAWQRRHPQAGLPIAVAKKFAEDGATRLAALIAYYAFFSLFPLLLAFVSVLGFVLQHDPTLRDDVVNTVLSEVPVAGAQLRDHLHPLAGSGVAVAVGLAGALWAGLAVTLAVIRAFATIWDVPRTGQPNGVRARARGLAALVVLAATLIASTAAAGLVIGGSIRPGAERGAGIALALATDGAFFLALFALLTPRPWRVPDLLPGVGLAVFGWLVLESVGGWYVNHTVAGASAIYGSFALVIGLLSWFWLGSQLLLVAAELNIVLSRHLWPRSLSGDLEPADRLVLEGLAEAARADPRERISVSFGESGQLSCPPSGGPPQRREQRRDHHDGHQPPRRQPG